MVQYRPTDTLDLTFDTLFTAFESPGIGAWQTNYPCPACGTTSNIQVASNNIITQFDSVISSEYLATEQQSDTDTLQFGANAVWQARDNLEFVADVSYSNAEGIRDNFGSGSGSGSFYVIGVPNSLFQYRYSGGDVPNIDSLAPAFDEATGQAVGPAVVGINDVDPRVFGAHFTRDTSNVVEDEVMTFKIDGTLDFDDETSLQFGFDFYDRNKTNQLYNNRNSWCNYWCGFEFSLRGLDPALFDSDFLVPFPVDDFLSDAGASVPNNFVTYSPQAVRDLYASVQPGDPILDSNGNPTTANNNNGTCTGSGTTHDFNCFSEVATGADILRPRLRRDSSTDLTETVFGVYGQLNFQGTVGGKPWEGNLGVRVARTELDSEGFSNEIVDIQPAAGADQIFTFSPDTPRNLSNSYTDVLPALNIAVYLTDSMILRGAFAETITRPTLTDLSTARTVTGTNVDVEAITSGNPELGPTRANNVDLSLEWYGDSITASAAVFYKDISDFIADAVTEEFVFDRNFQITRPTNGDTAEVLGLELAWTQYFDQGFGFQVNYTYADSEATAANGTTTSLENVSENTYNLSAFYEANGISARLSYNFRDDYVRAAEGLQGFPEIVDEYGQLDFTASYDINDYFTVFVEGANLTDEDEFVFSDQRNLLRYYEERG
ncbi:MAG: TonB-dependent receptor, partial [Pseudomonadota bacterium]